MENIGGGHAFALGGFVSLSVIMNTYGMAASMQIGFSDTERAYICLIPILPGHAVIHEEYDIDDSLNNTKVLPKEEIVRYIKNIHKISFVKITNNHANSDMMNVLYKTV